MAVVINAKIDLVRDCLLQGCNNPVVRTKLSDVQIQMLVFSDIENGCTRVVRGGKKCKYWNLHTAVMSNCSLIATQNSHAKKQSLSGSHTSRRWAPTRKSCTTKPQNEKWEEAIFLQILELTCCSHVGLFVDSHPKFTCQTQSISGSHTWAQANKTFEFLNNTSGDKKKENMCWRGTYVLFRWK